jgi:hypothetical protein
MFFQSIRRHGVYREIIIIIIIIADKISILVQFATFVRFSVRSRIYS